MMAGGAIGGGITSVLANSFLLLMGCCCLFRASAIFGGSFPLRSFGLLSDSKEV